MSKRTIARSVHANRGLQARYRREMLALIDEMVMNVERWAEAIYRPPKIAMDGPVESMSILLREFAAHWIKKFDDSAPKIAEAYLKGSFKATDSAMRQALKSAGWAVEFHMTDAMREAFEASLAENVGLIKSIPQEYLKQVEGIVMRSYSVGRDLETMVKRLKTLYPKASNRAVLIARDQSNKANAVVTRARQLELGIVEAIWMHSHAGKQPRPTHMAMNGKRYKVDKGMWDSDVGEFIYPGELINCRCTARSVLPFQVA